MCVKYYWKIIRRRIIIVINIIYTWLLILFYISVRKKKKCTNLSNNRYSSLSVRRATINFTNTYVEHLIMIGGSHHGIQEVQVPKCRLPRYVIHFSAKVQGEI